MALQHRFRDLYAILACPTCKVGVERREDVVVCTQCAQQYPIINGVPILFPDGSLPHIQHESELSIRTGYNSWIERVVMQSLPRDAITLDLGAGNMALSLPNVIRMDVTLTPYVDVVGDAHALPFLPNAFDFIFSLAVIEHLRQPFVAAQEMYATLRNGGYVFGECNFVFPYHGYPYHFFNASQQGIEQVFQQFTKLRASLAPYQMPSFAVRFVLETYAWYLQQRAGATLGDFLDLLRDVTAHPLGRYDSYFTEEEALRLAAGVFFFGVKLIDGTSDVIPEPVMQAWKTDSELQSRYPNPFDLGHADNILIWAKGMNGQSDHALRQAIDERPLFYKQPTIDTEAVSAFLELPVVEPSFGYIADPQARTTASAQKNDYIRELEAQIQQKNAHIAKLERVIAGLEHGRVMRILKAFKR